LNEVHELNACGGAKNKDRRDVAPFGVRLRTEVQVIGVVAQQLKAAVSFTKHK